MNQDSANPAASGRDVFVSYASQDVAVADAIVATLEKNGLECWIAPRDVTPGSQYADEIVGAINDARVLVLVLSQYAVASPAVGLIRIRELVGRYPEFKAETTLPPS
jgi:hypothetical protein